MTNIIGTLSFNTKANQAKVYSYLRSCSILAEKRTKSRGDHHLRVHVPAGRTWGGMVQSLAAQGYSFLNLGSE